MPDDVRRELVTCASMLFSDLCNDNSTSEIDACGFNLRTFLRSRTLDETGGSAEEKRVLDALSRKLEIRGELHCCYELPGFKPSPLRLAEPRDVDAFLTFMLLRFAQSGDYRLLNTVLKVSAGELRIPTYAPASALRALLETCMASLSDDA